LNGDFLNRVEAGLISRVLFFPKPVGGVLPFDADRLRAGRQGVDAQYRIATELGAGQQQQCRQRVANARPRAGCTADGMDFLVSQLSGQLSAPVEDNTCLTGKYDFTLSWIAQPPNSLNPDAEEAGPNLVTAVKNSSASS
jgi:uncharacterized protein (TIGR03435 family)